MGLSPFIEGALGSLLSSQKGRDAKLLTTTPAFVAFPHPTIEITSPDCGPSGSTFTPAYTALGTHRFPLLTWHAGVLGPEIAEYLVVVEDPDAPLPSPIVHGLYYGIARDVREFGGEEVKADGDVGGKEAGFRVGRNRRGTVYSGPRPVLGHGVHRYMFDVVALREKLDGAGLSAVPTKEEVARAVEGKVVGVLSGKSDPHASSLPSTETILEHTLDSTEAVMFLLAGERY